MNLAALLRRRFGAVALAVLAPWASAAGDALATARDLATQNNWTEVVATLEEHLRFELSTREIDDLMGQALTKLGRKDEAAHYLERAYLAWPEGDKELVKLKKRLVEADPLFARRDALFRKIAKELLQCASELESGGHRERALELLERLSPIATGADRSAIHSLADKIRSSTEEVDLDQAGGARPAGGWPSIKVESQRYTLQASLEPAVAELLGKTMDEIFLYYVQIYFDGDESKINERKATIVIHPSHEDMLKLWQGPPTVGGWWSPGEWQVHAYDTRPNTGTLDEMLLTLFHEASHHFMTMLARGGSTPAWLNEGTASFFEGASAMADGRVLWPDAAQGRLRGLDMFLKAPTSPGSRIPSFVDVISYDQPGSYPGEYYEFGWGIVYYLQQYEDATTLEYVYRPLYNAYRNEIIQKGGNPRELFERVFVGAKSPRGHQNLLEFERDWKKWIQGTIYPLHFGDRRRELRLAEVQRYVDAAALAANDKKSKVGERELLLRALGHIDYVRTKIDSADEPDAAVLLRQAELFEKVGQAGSAAPILERLLDMAVAGSWAASDAEIDTLGKRLAKLDSKNSALRLAKARTKALARTATKLLDDYRKASPPLLLRSYTFASLVSAALDNEKTLCDASRELRTQARASGVLKGATFKLGGAAGTWKTIFTNQESVFSVEPASITIEGVRPVGRLCTAVPIKGEYELRARVTREGEARVGAHHGLIVSGTENGDWIVMTITHDGRLMLKRMLLGKTGGVTDVGLTTVNLQKPPPLGQPFDFVAHLLPEGKVEVTIDGDGPYPFQLPLTPPAVGLVGVYVKNGRLRVENAVIEILP
ncbi:MAG: hypothetical protein IT454_18970 [Planctomycetes bacterium]|nr:hypothetical protein [Planctomycetota bacterium]